MRARQHRLCFGAAVLLGALVVAGPAAAEPLQLPVVNFKPPAGPKSYLVSEEGLTLPHFGISAAFLMGYVHRPLDLVSLYDDSRVDAVINYQLNMDVLLAVGFFDRLELGLALPFTLTQDSNDLETYNPSLGSSLSGGMGDVRISPKMRLVTVGPASFAMALPFSAPSGSRDKCIGEQGVSFSPRLIFSVDDPILGVAINAGYRIRADQSIQFSKSQSIAVDDEVFGSLGARLTLIPGWFDVMVDGYFSTSIVEQDIEEIPVEVLGGARFYLPRGFVATVGGGAGVTRGVGAPKFHILWGLGWVHTPAKRKPAPKKDLDPDRDGILGDQDRCPTVPEDKDNFEDTDGCPDTDNDKDGIRDSDDKCPNEPEDKDSFLDNDGCPDPDNDGDGILDTSDRCPNEPEDKDGFEDADGCPDTDNDGDGIVDGDDSCPNKPEDKDGFQDGDGCPDPDNDGDGILDADDKCPDDPETFNGVDDQDGCPDRSRGPVQIVQGRITVPPVFFATNKDVILARSFPVLRMVAKTLLDNPWIKRVRIEGHTDSRGSDAFNLDLSQRRAQSVMRFLQESGVDQSRLEAQGFGETQPIASNATRQGRAQNRRVDFVIVDPPQGQPPKKP